MFDDWWLDFKRGPGGPLDFLVYIGGGNLRNAYHDWPIWPNIFTLIDTAYFSA